MGKSDMVTTRSQRSRYGCLSPSSVRASRRHSSSVATFLTAASGAPALRRRGRSCPSRTDRQTAAAVAQVFVKIAQIIFEEIVVSGAAKKRGGKKSFEEHLEHRLDCGLVRRGIQNLEPYTTRIAKYGELNS